MREAAKQLNDVAVPTPPVDYFQVNTADRTWVESLCTPQPFATLTERIELTVRFHSVALKGYVLATGRGRNFSRFRDSVAHNPQWALYEIPCGHDVMIDMPEETAAILSGLQAQAVPKRCG
jgi:hypothetical protein